MKKGLLFYSAVLFLILLSSSFAQPSELISDLSTDEPIAGQSIGLQAQLVSPSEISTVILAFRNFGETEFSKREMEIRGTAAYGIIPGEFVKPPSLEYYLIITTQEGTLQTYPLGSPDQFPPLRLEVKSEIETSDDILILSPSQNQQVTKDELLISISFIKSPPDVDPKATKIYLGANEITEYCLFAEDLIIFSGNNYPEEINISDQLLKIEVYDNLGKLKSVVRRSFKVVSESYSRVSGEQFNYNVSFQGESRNEVYKEKSTWYNNLDIRFKGDYSNWKFGAKVYATSEEKAYRQPQNRYTANISTDWLDLTFGDSYPHYPELILSGKRVRGVDAGIDVGFFSLQASYGQITRDIEGELLKTYAASQTDSVLRSDVIEIDEQKYGAPFGKVRLGEYSRNILAIRPSFRSGETFRFGLTFLRGGDDKNSIEFGSKPAQNLVFGSDFELNFDNRKIQIDGEAAFSFLNSDIATGTLTDAQIDSVFGGNGVIDVDPDVVKRIKNILGNLIEVNQFFGPWNPEEFASFAGQASIGLNYFNNNLKFKYLYRGNDYTSFGQTYLRTDVQGINIVDRIRMIENKVFLNLGYERLTDNLQDTKPATTAYQTFNSSVSIYPGENIPNFTLGYTRYDNSNDLSDSSSAAVNDATNKFYLQISHKFMLEIPHNAYLYFSSSNRTDNTVWDRNSKNLSVTFNLKSEWNKTLSSHIGATYYTSESASLPYDYSSFFLGGSLLLLQDKLELRATLTPSFGDFERQAFDFVGSYRVIEDLVLSLQARFYRIPDVSTNSIIGLTTRYTL